MSNGATLKIRLAAMLGKGVLATTLAAVPIDLTFDLPVISKSSAYASEGGESGNSGNSGSGNSGSGSSNSGSGNSNSGSSNSGSGSSNSGSGNNNSGSSNSGETGSSLESGESANKKQRKNRHNNQSGRNRNGDSQRSFGRVAKSQIRGRNVELTYSDGWKERVANGRYSLKDARNRTVVERAARFSDYSRLARKAGR